MQEWKFRPATDLGLPAADRAKSLHRESGLISTGLHIAWWSAVRSYLAFWHRLDVQGVEHIPQQAPFVLVANHASHLDALVLASPLPWRLRDRIFPIAAGEVFFDTPVMSTFAAYFLNALPLWRKKVGSRTLSTLRERLLNEPCAYILFPEGGRSRDGAMMDFKPGLGMLIAETDVPIVPCYLDGCFHALKPGQKWPRPKRISVRIGPPIHFRDTTNSREGWTHIAAELQKRVGELAGNKPISENGCD